MRSKCHKNVFEKLTAIMPNQDYLISDHFSVEEISSKLKRIPISVKFVQIQRILELKDLLSKLKTVWSKGLGQRWANNVFGTKYEWYTGIQRMFSFWKWLNLLQIMFKLKAILGNILLKLKLYEYEWYWKYYKFSSTKEQYFNIL